MTLEERKKTFCENLKLLNKNLQWLEKSYSKSVVIDFNQKEFSEKEYEILETLTNRFGRTVDLMLNKVLRSLDLLELEESYRKLDIVIRAEKRGFVDNFNTLIEMKDLRNELVHEYIQEDLKDRFKEVIEYTPQLFKIIEKLIIYSKNQNYC
jgi:uncharacterized protein YutE (UPF0331/DUF86 family)